MAEESDGIEEAFEGQLRVIVTAAGLVGERLARAREEALRQAQARSEQEYRELQSRVDAERRAARVEMGNAHHSEWWDRATPEQIGRAYQAASAWSQEDPEAVRAEQRVREEVRARYGVDVNEARADPDRFAHDRGSTASLTFSEASAWAREHDRSDLQDALSDALRDVDTSDGRSSARREFVRWVEAARARESGNASTAQGQRAARENFEAQQLLAQSDQEEQRAAEVREAAEHEPDPEQRDRAAAEAEQREATGDRARQDGRTLYDSAERREATARELEAQGLDRETVSTRMRADVSQAKPANEAVGDGAARRSPKARKTRGRAAQQAQHHGLGR